MRQNTLAAAGRLGERFPRGRPVALSGAEGRATFDGIARIGGAAFRVVAVPLQFGDGTTVGTLYLATSLDAAYAEELARLAGTRTAIAQRRADGGEHAAGRRGARVRIGGRAASRRRARSSLNGESYAFRRLVAVGDTAFYALGSIDESSRGAMRQAMRNLVLHRGRRDRAGAARQHHAGAPAGADRSASSRRSLARMAASHDVTSRAAADRIEPRARRAHRRPSTT